MSPSKQQNKPKDDTSHNPLGKDFLATVSHGPGVYLMADKTKVLYVGKARDLRKRLGQYAMFQGSAHSKTGVMLGHIQSISTILTTTEKEALILEASLIKKHRPRYNVILRDDKHYPLIKVSTQEQWPRLSVTRKRLRDGARYFGPYASSSALKITLNLLYTMFPLRRCKHVRQRERPCLNYQMKRCLAPCAGKVDHRTYMTMIEEVVLVLEGKAEQVQEKLQKKMQAAASDLEFEKAALYRDQQAALTKTLERQMVVAEHGLDQDIFGLERHRAAVALALLFVRGGKVTGSQQFFLADPLGDDSAILSQTLLQYYSSRRQPPREILLPLDLDRDRQEFSLMREHLTELRGSALTIRNPKRGKIMQLMKMAHANAAKQFSEQEKNEKAWQELARSLQHKLRLQNRPETIECVDISNLQGKQSVGSLVCFTHGAKDKAGFRHYRIRLKDEPDDYAMMREVLERRLEKGIQQENLPDMLLLDGGKGQLNIGLEVLSSFHLLGQIDLVSIAKEKYEEGEKLFRPGRKNPILLPAHSPALRYLMQIRDESHRFGITFHRQLRRTSALHSALDGVAGVGPQRKKLLLHTFGSLKQVSQASEEELCAVPGIGPELASSIYKHLHKQ